MTARDRSSCGTLHDAAAPCTCAMHRNASAHRVPGAGRHAARLVLVFGSWMMPDSGTSEGQSVYGQHWPAHSSHACLSAALRIRRKTAEGAAHPGPPTSHHLSSQHRTAGSRGGVTPSRPRHLRPRLGGRQPAASPTRECCDRGQATSCSCSSQHDDPSSFVHALRTGAPSRT